VPFAHCTDCGTPALIDPSGRCPEGHEVGHPGDRVATAIGTSAPHPDEPKPWVGVVDIDPIRIDNQPLEPRVALPPSLPAVQGATPDVVRDPAPAVGSDDLLRELHALGDLDDLGSGGPAETPPSPARATAPPAAAQPPPPAPAAHAPVQSVPPANLAVTPGSPAPPSSPEEATDLDELASLAAAIGSLDDRGAVTTAPLSPPPSAPRAPSPTPASSADVIDELWAAAESSHAAPPSADASSVGGPPSTVPAPPPAPAAATTRSADAAVPVVPVPAAAPPGPLPAAGETTEPATSPFDGSFTARGVGRRTQRRLDEKAAKKGLFRR
jgi:hypothetical protein